MAVENLNSEMLRQRMMRGVVTGVAEPEKAPLKLCGGKVNGRPCRITVLSDEDFCRQHKKEMEMARNHCGINGCTRPVKNMGDKCWQHKGLDDQVAVGAVSDSALDHGHVDAATCTGSGLAAAAPPPRRR